MKKLLYALLIMSSPILLEGIDQTESIGFRYSSFLTSFCQPNRDDFTQEIESLFSPDVRKMVNSRTVCNNRDELLQQMNEVKKIYTPNTIHVLESFASNDNKSYILRWEITYKNSAPESIITIIKHNDEGLITEINEVFGVKEIYQWPETHK